MSRTKSKEPMPPNHHPRRYHGVGNNFVSLHDWEMIKFSNRYIRKPLVNDFRAKQRAAA